MLIYEKDNKLNINFENSVDGEPDLQIGKDGDKTQILVDGKESDGSSGGLPEYTVGDRGKILQIVDVFEEKEVLPTTQVAGRNDSVLFPGFDASEETYNALLNASEVDGCLIVSGNRVNPSIVSVSMPDGKIKIGWQRKDDVGQSYICSDGHVCLIDGNRAPEYIDDFSFSLVGRFSDVKPMWVENK
jgi:hypothetical protein